MITVTGYIGGVAYTAVIDAENTPDGDHPGYAGIVSGSPNILALLREHAGQMVAVSPTGPFVNLLLTDQASIVAALRSLTQVVNTTGDVGPVFEDEDDLPSDVVF